MQTEWSPENQTSRRALYCADWKRVSLLLRKLTNAGTASLWRPNPTKLRDIVLHQKDEKNTRSLLTFYAGQLEKNYANVARAADVLEFFLVRDTKERRKRYLGMASDGYITRPNQMSLEQVAEYERGLAAAMAQTDTHPLSPYAVEAYRQCAKEVRKIGATPIFVIPPSTTQINVTTENSGLTSVVMAFNNPRTYPSLYRSSAHRDGLHLSKSGAEEFTRIVAANFVDLAPAGVIE
jgi:hypothetical protein